MAERNGNGGPRWPQVAQVLGIILLAVLTWLCKRSLDQAEENNRQVVIALAEIASVRIELARNAKEHEEFLTRAELRYLMAEDTIKRLKELTGLIPEGTEKR